MPKVKLLKKTKGSKNLPNKDYIVAAGQSMMSSFALIRESLAFMYKHKKILFGVSTVFFVLYFFLVRSGSTFDIEATEQIITDGLGGDAEGLLNKTLLTGILLGSGASAGTGVSSLSSAMLMVFGSLAFIWSIRRLVAGKKFRVRDAYYKGMYPLVPFLLLTLLISLQMIPFAIGGFLYAAAELNGLIASFIERVLFVSGWVSLGLLSAYWLANSLISIYAVTLPDIYPLQALRSTRKVVKGRRWSVFLKMFVLSLFLFVATSLILLFAVLTVPMLAVYVYDALIVLSLLFTHIYLFKLYRSLI